VVTENVYEYRRCIAEHIGADDVVLAVGCAEGLTTAQEAQQVSELSVFKQTYTASMARQLGIEQAATCVKSGLPYCCGTASVLGVLPAAHSCVYRVHRSCT